MQYRIKEVDRYGFKLFEGALYTNSGRLIWAVEAWSAAGCLAALKRQAFKLTQAA